MEGPEIVEAKEFSFDFDVVLEFVAESTKLVIEEIESISEPIR